MKYELISIEDAGNHRDDIVRVRQVPSSWWDRFFRRKEKELVFYGQNDQWHTIDMTRLQPRMGDLLQKMWIASKTEHRTIAPQPCSAVDDNLSKNAAATIDWDLVDEALEETFPASDPPSWTTAAISQQQAGRMNG